MHGFGADTGSDDERWRIGLASRLLGVSMLVLMAATWRLWWPAHDLPSIPIAAALTLVPTFVDAVLLIVVAAALCLLAVRGRGAVILAISLGALLALDQLRWQAWAWHALLVALMLIGSSSRRQLVALRALTVAVYAYSAIAKLDVTFAETLGQQFLTAAVAPFGVDPATWPDFLRYGIACGFPITELIVAVLLVLPRTRGWGAALAVAMHAVLAVLLSPLGLAHSWGVVVWNISFAAMTWVLFAPRAWQPISTAHDESPATGTAQGPILPVLVATILGIVLPVMGWFSWWDPWPSWALYAPMRERADVYVARGAVERLPSSLHDHVQGSPTNDDWLRVDLGSWCLSETGAPLYPGTRVAPALALALSNRPTIGDAVRVSVQDQAGRWRGDRNSTQQLSVDELRRYLRTKWLGTQARE